MATYLVNFATHGDPNGGFGDPEKDGMTTSPRHEADNDLLLELAKQLNRLRDFGVHSPISRPPIGSESLCPRDRAGGQEHQATSAVA